MNPQDFLGKPTTPAVPNLAPGGIPATHHCPLCNGEFWESSFTGPLDPMCRYSTEGGQIIPHQPTPIVAGPAPR